MRGLALLLTVLTGFSGLVYQVAWQRYLAVLLGSHSEATAAVLGIFLGGLSVGYLLFGRVARRLMATPGQQRARVLFAYGVVESAIGLYAFAFASLFGIAQWGSLALPAGAEAMAFSFDVLLTALLIGPPTVLMGGTIPLLTQGLSTGLSDATRFHSWIYGFNTAGAFAGALCAGFLLVPWLGLERCVMAMGAVNSAAGLVFVLLARRERRRSSADRKSAPAEATAAPPPILSAARVPGASTSFATFAAAVLLSGFAMMSLQTALNRIGAISLGASQFTFSMVVAAFVLCIALGSLGVSLLPRIPAALLPLSQWGLAAYLLVLHPFVEDAPYWAHRMRVVFGTTEADFFAYQASVFGALLLFLLVPLGLSGALLPLVFDQLRRRVDDLGKVAGSLYSWNTVGSLLGALVGGYALFFWLDLHHVYRVSVLALAASAALLSGNLLRRMRSSRGLAAGAFALVAVTLLVQPEWSAVKLSSGLFRIREPFAYTYGGADRAAAAKQSDLGPDFLLFYDDDPIASISVQRITESSIAMLTNGKADGNIPRDNLTHALAGLLPAMLAEENDRAFVIGYGTGMTVGALAALDSVREVLVAEISPAVIEAAPAFEAVNQDALASPKTRIVRSDAYRTLLRADASFDVIVSEPSNPWVTGVEMLYSREFLQAARARLAPGGVFSQWFHTYESSDESVAMVLRTYLEAFDRVALWHGSPTDMILIGFADGKDEIDVERLRARFARPDFNAQLRALGIGSFPRLLAHELVPVGALARARLPDAIHTLRHPRLSDLAARAFFAGNEARIPSTAHARGTTGRSPRSLWTRYRSAFPEGPPEEDRLEFLRETCAFDLARCSTLFAQWSYEDPTSELLAQSLERARGDARLAAALEPGLLRQLAGLFAGIAGERGIYDRYYHHAAPFPPPAEGAPEARIGHRDSR